MEIYIRVKQDGKGGQNFLGKDKIGCKCGPNFGMGFVALQRLRPQKLKRLIV